ncbi:hypothetical protein M0805_000863 [Coniferiporia weirii]|nr:hypothetical protein M0805_000863 [Coniferiporia weirii]
MVSEELFIFSKIPLGDFECCLAFLENRATLDLRASADKLLWQAHKTFERLIKRDYEDKFHHLVQDYANQCVQQYALLDYGAECGFESLRKYLHDLILTSDWYRTSYLSSLMKLPPPERLEFIQRSVPGHAEKLRLFCVLHDSLYEKIEREARHRIEKSVLDRFQNRLENVQARLYAKMTVPATEIGRAI